MNDFVNVDNQIRAISEILRSAGQLQIVLADDVVFSGSVLRNVIGKFKDNQIEVLGIRTGISTIQSYDYFNSRLPFGLKCSYLMERDVLDQICERDFYFGIVQSGISVIGKDGSIYKAPYFKPFGNPIERASIPKEYERMFSARCIERSLNLWLEIERLSKREILMKDLPEKINTTIDSESVVKVLRKGRM